MTKREASLSTDSLNVRLNVEPYKCTFGGIILQIPNFSACGLILLIYSSGPIANSSSVGR